MEDVSGPGEDGGGGDAGGAFAAPVGDLYLDALREAEAQVAGAGQRPLVQVQKAEEVSLNIGSSMDRRRFIGPTFIGQAGHGSFGGSLAKTESRLTSARSRAWRVAMKGT